MGNEWGGSVPLSPPQPARGLERRKLPQRGLGQSPSRKRFWGMSCAILRDFKRLLLHLTAAWKWEIPTSLYILHPFTG